MLQCRTDAATCLARGRGATAFTVALLTVLAVAGCSTAQIDSLPKELGGLPESAPRRAVNPPDYPAVHDLPPARSKALMDPDEQKRLEADLVATRSRLQGQQKTKGKDAAKDQGKDAKKPAPERAATVKRGRRPTALTEENPTPGNRTPAVSARQPAAAPANPAAGGNAPAWPAPAGPDATGFGRNP